MKIVNFAKNFLEDYDESFFIQIKKVVDVTKKRFIVITLSLHEQNPYVDFPRVDRYLFPNDKLDTDFGPSMEMKGLCPEKISEAFVLCELKWKWNLGSMDVCWFVCDIGFMYNIVIKQVTNQNSFNNVYHEWENICK